MNAPQPSSFERLASTMRALARLNHLEPLLEGVIASACDLTESEAGFLLEADEQSRTLHLLAASPDHDGLPSTTLIGMDGTLTGRVVDRLTPLLLPDIKTSGDDFGGADLALVTHPRSVIVVPLVVRAKGLGALLAFNKSNSNYTEEDVTILETLAAPAAIAIDRKRLEQQLEISLGEVSDLERLKTEFTAITSHELRTPLGVILGHATYLREQLGHQHREQLDAIIKNAERLKEIVESLGSLDNLAMGGARLHPQPVSMGAIIDEVLLSFADAAREHSITLQAELGAKDLFAEADPTKISLALRNLVQNAITFTPAGGRVLVKGEAVSGGVQVSVIDNGIGIPTKDLPRVFERFFQVETHLTRHHGGLGLGLSVAKAMIEMHGGRIWVDSAEGSGSRFAFVLPAKAPIAETAMAGSSPPDGP